MIPTCAHLTVSAHDNGWSCRDCGTRFVLDRHAPLTPWSTLAAVVEERNRYYAEVAALRSQREDLFALGLSIHKHADLTLTHERARVNDILTRMASDAHDTSNAAAADALALAALAVQA